MSCFTGQLKKYFNAVIIIIIIMQSVKLLYLLHHNFLTMTRY